MPDESPGVLAQEEANKSETYQIPEDERKMVLFHRDRLNQAKQMRNSPNHKLDNLTFIADFYSNEDAANSYLRPKRNDDEVRIVGGTTEKRVESIANELEAMNWQHEIQSFDEDDADIRGLGKAFEDAVTRTNQLEDDEDVRYDAIWELCTQRAVFVEEILEEKQVGNLVQKMCRKRVRSAIEVILGDITMPAYRLQEQPFVATYDRMSISTARMFYGHCPNFKYVRGGMDLSADVYGNDVTFRLGILNKEETEIIKYMSATDNEYQIYINGVPMLPVGMKLPFQYPMPRYPLSVAIPKRMGHHFFYGRPVTSALKYLQSLNDEMVRNIIRKFRQAIEPPKAVLSQDRIYSRDIYNAGNISYGVNADSLKNLVEHEGITQGEMNVLQMVKSLQDELSARGSTQLGVQEGAKQTATAVIEQQKQAVKMLGQLVIAYTGLVRDWTKNRVFNLVETFSEPEGKELDAVTHEIREKFRRFTLRDQALDNGKVGKKIVQFMGSDLAPDQHEAIDDFEKSEEERGNPVRISVVNVRKLRNMTVNWYVTVTSKPKESDELHQLMFQDKLAQAQNVAVISQRPLNGERIVSEFQRTWRVEDWFKEPDAMGTPEMGLEAPQPGAGGQSELGQAATAGIGAGMKRQAIPNPTLKAAVGAVEGARP